MPAEVAALVVVVAVVRRNPLPFFPGCSVVLISRRDSFLPMIPMPMAVVVMTSRATWWWWWWCYRAFFCCFLSVVVVVMHSGGHSTRTKQIILVQWRQSTSPASSPLTLPRPSIYVCMYLLSICWLNQTGQGWGATLYGAYDITHTPAFFFCIITTLCRPCLLFFFTLSYSSRIILKKYAFHE